MRQEIEKRVCDECEVNVDLVKDLKFSLFSPFNDWIQIVVNENMQIKRYDFCSKKCLSNWLNRSVEEQNKNRDILPRRLKLGKVILQEPPSCGCKNNTEPGQSC